MVTALPLSPHPASASTGIDSGTVFLVEDDRQTGDALKASLSATRPIRTFSSAEDFLQNASSDRPACLLVDQRLPGISGNELLRRLWNDGRNLSTVLLTADADTPSVVEAMRHGAVAVLDKPCSEAALHDAVAKAIERDRQLAEKTQKRQAAADAITKLSDNEREVLQMVLDGIPNKQIARRLGVCVRTIESRRSKIYQTTGVNSVAELVRLAVTAGFIDS